MQRGVLTLQTVEKIRMLQQSSAVVSRVSEHASLSPDLSLLQLSPQRFVLSAEVVTKAPLLAKLYVECCTLLLSGLEILEEPLQFCAASASS